MMKIFEHILLLVTVGAVWFLSEDVQNIKRENNYLKDILKRHIQHDRARDEYVGNQYNNLNDKIFILQKQLDDMKGK